MPNYSMATIMRTHRIVKDLMAMTLVGRPELNVKKTLEALETWRETADLFAHDLYVEKLEANYTNNGQSIVIRMQWRLGIKLQPYVSTIVVSRSGMLEKSYQLDEEHAENSDLQDDDYGVDLDDG